MLDLLIPDTNVLLDVVRARAVAHGNVPAPATTPQDASLVSRLVAAGELRVGLLPLVQVELTRNIEIVMQDARRNYRELVNRLARLRLGALPPSALKAGQLIANDKLIVDQLVAQADPLSDDEEDLRRAEKRYARRRPPAHAGKSSTHDSRVLEGALRAARTREPGTTWLVTRNTTEFEMDGRLHLELQSEYDDAGLSHARSWRDYLSEKQLLQPPS